MLVLVVLCFSVSRGLFNVFYAVYCASPKERPRAACIGGGGARWSIRMDVNERHRAMCAIGGLRPPSTAFGPARPPLLIGSGFCINGQHRIICSCAHVWRDIERGTNLLLNPAVHGVAIGFQPNDRARAERGEVDWVGRAMLLDPPGVLDPPMNNDGLDFVALQLTQQLDGALLPPGAPPLVALPLTATQTC